MIAAQRQAPYLNSFTSMEAIRWSNSPKPWRDLDFLAEAGPVTVPYQLAIWGTAIYGEGRQLPHIHPNGWLSWVVHAATVGAPINHADTGVFEFGQLDPFQDTTEMNQTVRVAPLPGLVVFFPTYYYYRTRPTHSAHHRICIAFDVELESCRIVPDSVDTCDVG